MQYKFPDKPQAGILYYIKYKGTYGTKMGFGCYMGDHMWKIHKSGRVLWDDDIIEWRTINEV